KRCRSYEGEGDPRHFWRLLLGVKRKSAEGASMSANDPKRTSPNPSSILEMQVHHSAQRTVGSVRQLLRALRKPRTCPSLDWILSLLPRVGGIVIGSARSRFQPRFGSGR